MSPEERTQAIHLLAYDIERAFAVERCRGNGRFRRCTGRNAKELRHQAVASEFDPHAATELAWMIERRLFPEALKAEQ